MELAKNVLYQIYLPCQRILLYYMFFSFTYGRIIRAPKKTRSSQRNITLVYPNRYLPYRGTFVSPITAFNSVHGTNVEPTITIIR